MAFCLPKFAADALTQKLTSGEITPDKLTKLNSAQRREVFSFLGEVNAKNVNALFESKLLLKNQQLAMIRWAEQVLRMKPKQRRDTLATVERMKDVLTEKEMDLFLEDLIEKKLGFDVTQAEAGKLVDLAKNVETFKKEAEASVLREDYDLKTETKAQLELRTKYGVSKVLFDDYVISLKPEGKPLTFKEFISTPGKYLENIGNITKSVVASIDNSFFGNQGIATLINPSTSVIWGKNIIKSVGDLKKGLQGVDPSIAAKAEAYSRPNALNGKYDIVDPKIGLRAEEAYPTSLPERIPVLGRLFTASSGAYNSAAIRLRADLADLWIKQAEKMGGDITDPVQGKAIGRIVNSYTGRGSLGALEAAGPKLNAYFFSPKLMKGTFDTLTLHLFDPKVPLKADPLQPLSYKNISPATRIAAKNLVNMAAVVQGIMYTVNSINPGHAEPDVRSTNWGKVKVGNTWVSIVGPFGPMVRIASRLIPTQHNGKTGFWMKNSKGKWTRLGENSFGFNALDLFTGFFEGKASPLFAVLLNHWRGRDFAGDKPTLTGDIKKLATPISVSSFNEDVQNPKVENAFLNLLLNANGFNTYTPE